MRTWKITPSTPFFLSIGIIYTLVLFLAFRQGSIYASNIILRIALDKTGSQKYEEALNLSQKSLELNPYSEETYIFDSQISMTLANNMKSDNNASETAKIVNTLISRSINSTKTAISINPSNSGNYGLLASIYSTLIQSSKEAPQLAFNAYQSQLNLDPNSPQVRMSVGQLMLNLQQVDSAYTYFSQALNLNPNWNIPHYNIANILAKAGKYREASDEFQKTLDLTAQKSEDYKKVQSELESVKRLIPPEISTPSTAPKPLSR